MNLTKPKLFFNLNRLPRFPAETLSNNSGGYTHSMVYFT